jgi:hypothetical protein
LTHFSAFIRFSDWKELLLQKLITKQKNNEHKIYFCKWSAKGAKESSRWADLHFPQS